MRKAEVASHADGGYIGKVLEAGPETGYCARHIFLGWANGSGVVVGAWMRDGLAAAAGSSRSRARACYSRKVVLG